MRALPPVLLLLGLAACESPPIQWSEPVEVAVPSGDVHLAVDTAGLVRFVADSTRTTGMPSPAPCPTPLRTAMGAAHLFAAWWSARPDSSAVLYTATSQDSGKTWGTASAVDTTDVSSRGCNRPPPSLTTVGDDVYVAYSMVAPEGTGVFFAHTMGSMLHSPVAVIYGERIVPVAIAAEGDRVAVAYEEPNGKRQQIDVALSVTMGHIFETHTVATRSVDVAVQPAVALAGHTVAVAWSAPERDSTARARVVRVGRIK